MLLRAIELVVRHHPSLPPVLDRVSVDLAAGEIVAVVGANGSGKSTLARALAGLLPLESGSIAGPAGREPRVGLVLQDPAAQLVAVTVADELALGPQHAGLASMHVARNAEAHARMFGLEELWPRDPATLSGGQQQRVAVAAIEACDVEVLVLDEPTALLDEPARRAFGDSVRGLVQDRAIVWITQEPDEVEQCDRVIVLDAGSVVWDGPLDAWLADPSIAATWHLNLPAAARIAHALQARGVDAGPLGIPRSLHELRSTLLTGTSNE